ncbi:MAG: T9SS type A sorting domain-containing protein [Bacteroidota bacterium]
MKIINNYVIKSILLLLIVMLFVGARDKSVDKGSKEPERLSKVNDEKPGWFSDSYYMFINKIAMPMNSKGVMADVVIGDNKAQGRIDGKNFLFSGGFMMSGVDDQGVMWANGSSTASRVEDYIAGQAAWDTENDVQTTDDTYAGMYLIRTSDEHFGPEWQTWAEAVEAGAYFYDGDGDGVYNPVDKNGNGEWDPEEDCPDILGDETVWCVYNDAIAPNTRRFPAVNPQGIEIRQTSWAYATAGDLGNIMFVRYSLLNTGLVSEFHDSVYFSVWADPDLGNFNDDLVGSDPFLNAGYVYNDGSDETFGVDPPCFLIDFFQGPWTESEDPNDFALNVRGPLLGVDTIWGNTNMGLSSFVHYMQGNLNLDDPDDEFVLRNYTLGLDMGGNTIDPCNWEFGTVYKEDCGSIDPTFLYSGDPVTLTGWINNLPFDQRQMSNTGPIRLEKDKPVDLVVAYVVGRSTSAVASVKETKKIDRAAQFVFQNNFNVPAPPPAIEPIIKANDNAIELIWETWPQVEYSAVGVGFDMHFEYYEVKMYQSNVTADQNDGRENAKVIARYDIENEINALIYENPVSDERTIIYPSNGIQLDSTTYFSRETGRISLIITQDPFTNGPLQKNKPYFFTITSTAVNRDEIEIFDALGTWIIPKTATIGTISNVPIIINDDNGNDGILTGESQNEPFYAGVSAEHVEGDAVADVTYSVQNKDSVTTNSYEVGFFQDSLSIPYVLYYYIKDLTTGVKLIDSSKSFLFEGGSDFDNEPFFYEDYYREQINNLVDGITVTVPWIDPGVDKIEFKGDEWFLPLDDSITGGFYVGKDVSAPSILPITSKTSSAISVADLKKVELRFGSDNISKAHRYVRRNTGRYPLGDNTGDTDSSFVDVPFAAYELGSNGEERRLAVGFTETANELDSLRMPDAVYYPGSIIEKSKEYIIIFKASYDETGTVNLPYFSAQQGRLYADIATGYKMDTPPEGDPGVIDSLKAVAKSAWFDAMYVCGFETDQPRNDFNPSGVFTLYPGAYLQPRDKYQFTVQVDMTVDDARANWEKVNVFPNPLFGINEGVSYTGGRYDEPYVTFNNLPNDVTIKIYSLSGVLLRTLEKSDASSIQRWDLENESGLRVASGMYIALVSNPEFGDRVLKLAIIMPQKQIQMY